MRTPHPRRRAAGFTLVEVMVVVVILGLLATMVAMNVTEQSDYARQQRIESDLASIADATKLYYVREGRLPSFEDLLLPDEQDRAYLEDPSNDPWDRPYAVREGDSARTFVVICAGSDGEFGTEDDLQKRARR